MVLQVDVAVVGAGIAGMSVAAELSPDLSVAVLEQEEQLAYHASGRSAAAFLESYGSAEIRALTRASRPLFDKVDVDGADLDGADQDGATAPLLRPRRLLWVASASGMAELSHLVQTEPLLRPLTGRQAREYCPGLREEWLAGAAAEDGAQDLDVAGLYQHYRRRALRGGVTIKPRARVHAAGPDGSGWRLNTEVGEVRAAVVVNAAGAWADLVARCAGVETVGLAPLRRTVAIVSSNQIDRSWPLVCDVLEGFYFRPEGDALLLSPADETASEPGDARPDTVDIAFALERANEATTLGLRHVRTSWAGLRTFAPDRNPVVGMDPDHRGFFWLAGQGGYGMQTAPALAELAATLIRGEAPAGELAMVADRLSPHRFRSAPVRDPDPA